MNSHGGWADVHTTVALQTGVVCMSAVDIVSRQHREGVQQWPAWQAGGAIQSRANKAWQGRQDRASHDMAKDMCQIAMTTRQQQWKITVVHQDTEPLIDFVGECHAWSVIDPQEAQWLLDQPGRGLGPCEHLPQQTSDARCIGHPLWVTPGCNNICFQ